LASIHKSIHHGAELLRQGKNLAAADLYRKVVAKDPGNSDALHLLAVALFQLGQAQRAIDFATKAIAANAQVADYHSNLGRYYLAAGDLAKATKSLLRALDISPDHALAQFNLGLVRQAQQRWAEAERHYRRYTELRPEDAGGHNSLGNLLGGLYRFPEARTCFERVVELQPEQAEAWNNLGNSEQQLGLWNKALRSYDRALALRSEFADAHSNRGAALQALGRLDEAESCYRRALEIDPAMVQARGNVANLLAARGKHHEAIAAYRDLLREHGPNENLLNNLGNSCQELGQYPEALEAYQAALRLNPNAFTIFNNIGNCHRRQAKHEEALEWYRKALAVWPEFAEALNNIGVTLQDMGRLGEAVPYFERALAAREDYVDPLINLSNNLRDRGRPEQAISCLRRAAELRPGNQHIWNNLGCSLGDQGRVAEAIDCLRRSLAIYPDSHHAYSNLLLNVHYLSGIAPLEIFRLHREFQTRFAAPATPFGFPARSRDPRRVLRVGYVSSDFRRHSVAFFLEPVLDCHDTRAVHFYCYSDAPREDSVTASFRAKAATRWRDIRGMNDDHFAALVARDEIDILVDLGGHTAGNRLRAFSRRLAPIQVTWLGYPGTTGLDSIDYRITDERSDPPGATDHLYSEKLLRLGGGFLCYRPAAGEPDTGAPPSASQGVVTFGSFNNMAKMSAQAVRMWAQVLLAVPSSRLALKNKALSEAPARGRVIEEFARHGIAESRILMSGAIESLEGHLEAYRFVDIALDSFPYNGTTTTCEALWMGVPVVTMAGETHVSRVGASLLSQAGLDGCIAANEDDFATKAASLASQAAYLRELRSTLRSRLKASSLMDEPGFTRKLEECYREIWRNWCQQETHV